jgi:hypothetical protein
MYPQIEVPFHQLCNMQLRAQQVGSKPLFNERKKASSLTIHIKGKHHDTLNCGQVWDMSEKQGAVTSIEISPAGKYDTATCSTLFVLSASLMLPMPPPLPCHSPKTSLSPQRHIVCIHEGRPTQEAQDKLFISMLTGCRPGIIIPRK